MASQVHVRINGVGQYSQTSPYGHLIITDSLLIPWGNKALNSTPLMRTRC